MGTHGLSGIIFSRAVANKREYLEMRPGTFVIDRVTPTAANVQRLRPAYPPACINPFGNVVVFPDCPRWSAPPR